MSGDVMEDIDWVYAIAITLLLIGLAALGVIGVVQILMTANII